jgi:hypothetical protein
MCFLAAAAVLASYASAADSRKLTPEERIELIRGLTAEYATAKRMLPSSKSALELTSTGLVDEKRWGTAEKERGPAAEGGDLVQITKVTLESKRIVLEINGGIKGGRKWYESVQVSAGSRSVPLGSGPGTVAKAGTSLALVFPDRVPALRTDEVKRLLAPLLDFASRSASEHYVESLPPEIQKAVKDKRVIAGMNREQVIAALGKPENKVRTYEDGTEYEDWIFGKPPGRIIFVTFEGDEVVRVKESYAGIGGSVAPPLPAPR